MRKTMVLMAALALGTAGGARAGLVEKTWDYEQGGQPLEGYLVYDDAVGGPRPGVLVVHQWMGLTENERMRARMLAKLGYVALCADVYGKGIRPADTKEASAEAGKFYKDRALFRARLEAGLNELLAMDDVDRTKVAAIGYCFGGGGVLELARAGADIAGVVSFHGSLGTSLPAQKGEVKAKILVCQGALDPYAGIDDVHKLVDELEAAGADYEVNLYAHAVHAFTQKEAGDDPGKGVAYNAEADRRSWQAMKDFFAEIFH